MVLKAASRTPRARAGREGQLPVTPASPAARRRLTSPSPPHPRERPRTVCRAGHPSPSGHQTRRRSHPPSQVSDSNTATEGPGGRRRGEETRLPPPLPPPPSPPSPRPRTSPPGCRLAFSPACHARQRQRRAGMPAPPCRSRAGPRASHPHPPPHPHPPAHPPPPNRPTPLPFLLPQGGAWVLPQECREVGWGVGRAQLRGRPWCPLPPPPPAARRRAAVPAGERGRPRPPRRPPPVAARGHRHGTPDKGTQRKRGGSPPPSLSSASPQAPSMFTVTRRRRLRWRVIHPIHFPPPPPPTPIPLFDPATLSPAVTADPAARRRNRSVAPRKVAARGGGRRSRARERCTCSNAGTAARAGQSVATEGGRGEHGACPRQPSSHVTGPTRRRGMQGSGRGEGLQRAGHRLPA